MPPKNSLTLQAALKTAVAKLIKAKIDSAWLDAELLLAFVLKKNRTFVLSHDEKILSVTQAKRFHALIQKRAKHLPVAYVLGEKEFYGLNFKVSKDTLVPRPFSESLVERAIEILNNNPKAILVDIGTGSGCLIISTLKNISKKHQAYAIDISKQALNIARANATRHKVKINFLHGNLLTPIAKKIKAKSHLVILANLPYLNDKEMKERSIQKEPKRALYGGTDGLDLYRKLAKQIIALSKTKHIEVTLISEMNARQNKRFDRIWE